MVGMNDFWWKDPRIESRCRLGAQVVSAQVGAVGRWYNVGRKRNEEVDGGLYES